MEFVIGVVESFERNSFPNNFELESNSCCKLILENGEVYYWPDNLEWSDDNREYLINCGDKIWASAEVRKENGKEEKVIANFDERALIELSE